MLVLSRKQGERIRINDDIELVIVEIRGDKVRVGVEAPDDVPVHREEVYQAIQRKREVERGDGQGAPHTEIHGTEAAPLFIGADAALGE